MFFKGVHKLITQGLLFFSKDKEGGTAVAEHRKSRGSDVVDLLSKGMAGESIQEHDADWGEVDVLLQNWQADILRPEEDPRAAKLPPVSDEVLDNVLLPPEPQKPKLKTKIRNKIPLVKEARPVRRKKTVVPRKEPSPFRRGIFPGETSIKFLRFRTDPLQGVRPVVRPGYLAAGDLIACRICGAYVPHDQIIDSMYCSTECQQFYNLCDMCHRPYVKDHQGQRFCSDPACQMRYIRKPGIRKIEYVLIEE